MEDKLNEFWNLLFEDPALTLGGTVFDPTSETFGPIMAAIQAGDFEVAVRLLSRLAAETAGDDRTNTFDAETLDDDGSRWGSRQTYLRRCERARTALKEFSDNNDPETDAKDVISDILTFVYGPAGTYDYSMPSALNTVPDRVDREDAQRAARTLLDGAFESWFGDAEDYSRGA